MPYAHTIHLRRFVRVLRPFGMLLLLFLLGFQSIPVWTGIDADAITAVGNQRVRAEVFARDVQVLQYRSVEMHAQAIADLQAGLPFFEAEEQALANDPRPDVQIVVAAARPDYLAIQSAVQAILAQPDGPVDPIEVTILLQHDRPYLLTMNSVSLILTQSSERKTWFLFWTELTLDLLLLGMALLFAFREERDFAWILSHLPPSQGEHHGTDDIPGDGDH